MTKTLTNNMDFSDNTPRDVFEAAAIEHVNAKPSADIKTVDLRHGRDPYFMV